MLELTTDGARGALGAAQAQGQAAALAPEEDAGALSSDFDTFLQMLTAQLRNQDPLNPMESADFAVQLATFSGVEQQVLTNELLREGASAGGGASHAEWIGLEALSAAPAAFDGAPLSLRFDAPGAAEATLMVTDAYGREVGRHAVDPSQGEVSWAGTDEFGEPLPDGRYGFSLLVPTADGTTEALPVATYARVVEVRPGADGTRIVLDGGGEVDAAEVTALRAPAEEDEGRGWLGL